MASPALTVIIPTCNRPKLLATCLAAIAPGTQTLPGDHYEVVVTDDGNSTESQELVRSLYPWAKWVEGPRNGPAANRNRGVAIALGEWLVFIDDDCIPKSELLASYQAAIVDACLVYEGKTTCEGWRRDPLETAPINEAGGFLWSCNMMVHAPFFSRLGGFDERFPFAGGEDVEFRERLCKLGKPIMWVPAAVVDHPPRPRSLFVKAALREESQVPLLLLRGVKNPYAKLVPYTIKSGLRNLYRSPFSRNWIIAAASLFVQSASMLLLLPSWKRRYGFSYEHPGEHGAT